MKKMTIVLSILAAFMFIFQSISVAGDFIVTQQFFLEQGAGYAGRGYMNESWSSIRESAGQYGNTASLPIGYRVSTSNASLWRNMYRTSIPVNTSDIPAISTILNATFHYYPTTVYDTLDTDITIVSSGVASTDTITSSDYNYLNWGTTNYSTPVNLSDVSVNTYNVMELNSNGISYIEKDGVTDFGLRSIADINNIEPTENLSLGANGNMFLSTPNTPEQSPYFEITYICDEDDIPTNNIVQVIPYYQADYNSDGNVDTLDLLEFIADNDFIQNYWINNIWKEEASF